MSFSESFVRATKRVAAVGSLALIAFVAIGEQTSHASGVWEVTDGFENGENPTGVWSFQHAGSGQGGFDLNHGVAHAGQNDAWVTSQSGWSAVGRTVRISTFPIHPAARCAVRLSVQAFGKASGRLEVIDPDTWNYVTYLDLNLTGTSYVSETTPSFVPTKQNVFVRFAINGDESCSAARVDDLIVECAY